MNVPSVGYLPPGSKGALGGVSALSASVLARACTAAAVLVTAPSALYQRVLGRVLVSLRTVRLVPVIRSGSFRHLLGCGADAVCGSCAFAAYAMCFAAHHAYASVLRGVRVTLRTMRLGALCRTGCAATLPVHVGVVVRDGAEKQVLGIDASWVVAVVADEHPIRDGAVVQLPRHTMGELTPSFLTKIAVAEHMLPAGPQPARVGTLNFHPEASWIVVGAKECHRSASMASIARRISSARLNPVRRASLRSAAICCSGRYRLTRFIPTIYIHALTEAM